MRKLHLVLATLALSGAAAGSYTASIAHEPDFEIEMTRIVPSKLSPAYLDDALKLIRQWPAWYFSAESATQVDWKGNPLPKDAQRLAPNTFIRLGMNTHRGWHDKYQVTVQVVDYVPGKRLRMRVIADSKNHLTRMFDPLDWVIELQPQGTGTLIVGKAVAQTHSWRARVLGKLVPSILLNQVYYPNLFTLAEINNPNVAYPDPETQQPM